MKERNDIYDFFRKKLIDEPTVESDWNVPSEDIYMAAKKHFPKKKKRRYFFFLISLGMITAFGGLIFSNLWNKNNDVSDVNNGAVNTKIQNNDNRRSSALIEVQQDALRSKTATSPVNPGLDREEKSMKYQTNYKKTQTKNIIINHSGAGQAEILNAGKGNVSGSSALQVNSEVLPTKSVVNRTDISEERHQQKRTQDASPELSTNPGASRWSAFTAPTAPRRNVMDQPVVSLPTLTATELISKPLELVSTSVPQLKQ